MQKRSFLKSIALRWFTSFPGQHVCAFLCKEDPLTTGENRCSLLISWWKDIQAELVVMILARSRELRSHSNCLFLASEYKTAGEGYCFHRDMVLLAGWFAGKSIQSAAAVTSDIPKQGDF